MIIVPSLNARARLGWGVGVGSGTNPGSPSKHPYGLLIKHHGNLPLPKLRTRLGRGVGGGVGA